MTITQYQNLKKLIQQARYTDSGDVLVLLNQAHATDLKEIILQYRKKCIQEIQLQFRKLSYDDIDECFFKALTTFTNSIEKDNFTHKDDKSIYNYLLRGCKNQAIRTWDKKKKYDAFLTPELPDRSESDNNGVLGKMEDENLRTSMFKALGEMHKDCKSIIESFFLDEMSHKEIVQENPALKNEKNASMKLRRCLSKLRRRAVDIFKKNEMKSQN